MAEKRVSVRLGARGGDRVKGELEGVGKAGERGFNRLSREAEAASKRLDRFARRAKVAAAAAAAAIAATAGAMIRSSLQTIDAQAKMAESLDTTVESIQVLQRAGELAGLSVGELDGSLRRFTRRVSLAEQGTGPAVDALERLGISAKDLADLPLDERIDLVLNRLREYIPAAQQAGVATQLFGDETGIAFARLDSETIRLATTDIERFGAAVSEQDAAQIERTNDAISRLGLVWQGVANQLTAGVAPALEATAEAIAQIAERAIPVFRDVLEALGENFDRIVSIAGTFAAFMAGRFFAGMVAAAVSVRGLATALVFLRGALIRTGIGALIVGAGELVYQFTRLVRGAGSFGEAMELLGDVARGVWDGMGNVASAWLDGFRAMAAQAKATWFELMMSLQRAWADFLHMSADSVGELPGMEETFVAIKQAAIAAGSGVYEYQTAMRSARAEAERLSGEEARKLETAFDGARDAVKALMDAVAAASDDGSEGLGDLEDAADGVREALEKAGQAASGGAGGEGEAGQQSGRGLSGSMGEAGRAADTLDDRLRRVRSSTERAFGAIVSGALAGEDALKSVRNAVGNLAQEFSRMLANRAFQSLWSGASGLLGGLLGGGSGGASLPKVIGNPNTSLLGSSIQMFASGTSFAPGGAAIVGERGPELVNLPRGAQVLDAQRTARALGGAQHVTVDLRLTEDLDARVAGQAEGVAVRVYNSREPGTVRRAVGATYAANSEVRFE